MSDVIAPEGDYSKSQNRVWDFVINNYTDEEIEHILRLQKNARVRWIVAYKEVGTEGTPHIQGAIGMDYAIRGGGLHKLMPPRTSHRPLKEKSTPALLVNYCRGIHPKKTPAKDEDRIIDTFVQFQGQRCDIAAAYASVDDGMTELEFMETTNPGWQAIQVRRAYKRAKQEAKDEIRNVYVEWHYGHTNVGKSGSRPKGAYECPEDSWMCGYDGQEAVILNEITPKDTKLEHLLKLMDIWPYKCRTKGGQVMVTATHIFVTSEQSPEDWGGGERIQHLLRRINKIVQYERKPDGGIRRIIRKDEPLKIVHVKPTYEDVYLCDM